MRIISSQLYVGGIHTFSLMNKLRFCEKSQSMQVDCNSHSGLSISKDKYSSISIAQIKQAYSVKVKQCHPDIVDIGHIESAKQLAKLKTADNILSNVKYKVNQSLHWMEMEWILSGNMCFVLFGFIRSR